jgi:hypothetical protein
MLVVQNRLDGGPAGPRRREPAGGQILPQVGQDIAKIANIASIANIDGSGDSAGLRVDSGERVTTSCEPS